MAKSSRFKYAYRSNASKHHKRIGEAIRSHPILKNMRVYQEYPVNKINPNFKDGRCKIDWVILDIKIAIEVHGEQHYGHVRFGGISKEEAERKYREQVIRDEEKKAAVEAAGFAYIAVKYDEDLDVMKLFDKVISNENQPYKPPKKERKTYPKRELPPELKEKQKEYQKKLRKELYQKKKDWVKSLKK